MYQEDSSMREVHYSVERSDYLVGLTAAVAALSIVVLTLALILR